MPTLRPAALRRALLALSVNCCVAGCSKSAPPVTPSVPVTVALATRGPAPNVVEANGQVTPIQAASVAAQVSGLVTAVTFREGEVVERGQVLFRIDPRPYAAALAQAEASLAHDEAQAANARRGVERFDALVKDDYVTRSAADSQRANSAALAATVRADRAAIARARFDLGNTVVRAPITGRTGSVLVKEGNLVAGSPTQPLVVINQIDPIQVRFDLPASVFRAVQTGSRARQLPVRVAPPDSGDSLWGRLTFVDNAVDTVTGTLQLKAEFSNARGRLWPGQFVPVTLQLDVQPDAVLVPASAVQTGQQGTYVFIVGADDRASMRTVGTSQTVGNAVVVTRGLVGGERVVTDGQARLGTASRVRILASQPGTKPGGQGAP